ncbi:MAG: HK97 gp10 family phage protein [Butyrivibrio sp.]|nr:HK97 gp10 family phage protein [Butyrivibrio sp.]
MSDKVKIDKLADTIIKGMTAYAELATDEVKKAVKDAGNLAKKEISSNAPVDTGKYAKSWAVKNTKETPNSLEVTVHSRNRYQIAHLLEKGHALRGGGRASARPHIAPAEEKAVEELEKEIGRRLAE